MSVDRYYRWCQRLHTSVAGLPLDFGNELWGPLDAHPARAWIAEQPQADGAEPRSDSDIRHQLTSGLLDNVVHAAGGIEYAAEKIKAAICRAQARLDENPFSPGPEPEQWRGFADVPVDEAHYEFLNLLAWMKALEERLDRRVPNSKPPARLGLLPALAQNTTLQPRVQAAVEILKQDSLSASRYLANFAVHASAIPYPGAGARVNASGRVFIPIPDPPKQHIGLFEQFTWFEKRDLASFAEESLSAVERFVDALLGAFEDAARVRRAEPKKFFTS